MGFDLSKFRQQQYTYRTEAVPVPGLKDLFGEEEKPEWVVRGLTAAEIHQVHLSIGSTSKVELLTKALLTPDGTTQDKIQHLRRAIGLPSAEVPDETKRRMEMLVIATVEPEGFSLEDAVKLQQVYPIEFIQITNKINGLTGRGQVESGESKPSGQIASSGVQ